MRVGFIMTTMDKAGIGIAVAVVAIALGFTAFSGSGSEGITPIVEKSTTSLQETSKEIQESSAGVFEKGKETIQQIAKDTKNFEKTTKELTTSKLPARLVSIPKGTSIPACEEVNLCYDPSSLIIFSGGEIIWKNDDTSAHTVTSGNIIEGPDGFFDSGLIKVRETFSFKFEKPGNYEYFCMIHPWANGSITVK